MTEPSTGIGYCPKTGAGAGAYTVPAGKCGHLESYSLHDVYTFEVSNNPPPYVQGYGQVNRPVGFCY